MKKFLLKILPFIIIICSISGMVFASYIPEKVEPGLPDGTQVPEMTQRIIGALMWIGYAIGLGMVIYVGIKYVMASADEKASLKGMLTKIVIGALIIASAVTITNIAITMFS